MDSKKAQTDTQYPLIEGDPRGAMAGSPAKEISNFHLYLAACAANLAAFAAGNTLTWSSPTIPRLQEDKLIETDQESWLGSLIALGASVGPFIAGAMVDKVGRKPTLLLTASLFLISWALIFTALNLCEINYPMIYVARVIAGMSCGITYTVIPMYVGEISESSVRGALGSLLAFFLVAGFLLEYTIGPYATYSQLILASSVAPVLFAVSFLFMPESPYYLLMKNEKAKALRSLQWLRGASDANYIQKELTEMQSSVEETLNQSSGFSQIFASKGNIKALYLSCGLVAFQQLSGINVILFYSEPIFKETGAGLSASACTIIVGGVMLLAAGIAPPMAKCLGIKWLLIISAIGMAVFQGVLGYYFFLKTNGHDIQSLKLLPVGCVVAYIIVYCLGFGPLPWAVMGEMYPSNIKAKAASFTAAFCWFLGFIMTKSFSTVKESLGQDVAFWLFAGFCIAALLFTIFLLPDTSGLSLQEIQDLLNGRPVRRKK